MTKPLYLTILPVLLLACVEENTNIYMNQPCVDVEVNVEINQEYGSDTGDLTEEEHLTDEDFATENHPEKNEDIGEDSEEPMIDERDELDEIDETDELEEINEFEIEELHSVQLQITADDHWEGWINGEYIGEDGGYTTTTQVDFELPSGHHVLAIKATDTSFTINGLIASVDLDGESYSITGDGQWLASKQSPIATWIMPSYNDSDWDNAQACSSTYLWNQEPEALIEEGAEWIWYNFDCKRNIGTSWFRLHIVIE
jgi:hypothetical protein